jgi:hypothetical protein
MPVHQNFATEQAANPVDVHLGPIEKDGNEDSRAEFECRMLADHTGGQSFREVDPVFGDKREGDEGDDDADDDSF